MQRLAWVILSLRANCVSSLRNWRTNLQPLKVRWPWLPVGLHRTLMITPPPFFMVFRRRRLWFFNNPGDFHGLPSAGTSLPLVFQQPCHSYYLPLATTGLDHYNVAVTYKYVFLYEKHFSYKWKPNSQIFAVTYKYSLRFSRSGDKIQHPMHMQED